MDLINELLQLFGSDGEQTNVEQQTLNNAFIESSLAQNFMHEQQ